MRLAGLIILCLVAAVSAEGGVFLGCYKDWHDPRDLQFGYLGNDHGMTIQKCIEHCRDLNFTYAALQDTFECWCDNKYGTYGKSSKCELPCQGNEHQICGGYFENSIYTTIDLPGVTACKGDDCIMSPWGDYSECKGICGKNNGLKLRFRTIEQENWCGGKPCGSLRESTACTRDEPCDPGPYQYLGCFGDARYDRVLPYAEVEDTYLKIDWCIDHCKRAGYDLAGMQYGYECWCGKADEDFRRHGAGGCDYYCGGDDTTYCGGGWSISVYNTSTIVKCEPIDCVPGEWTGWSDCGGSCGEGRGRQQRHRHMMTEADCGGEACPTLTEEKPCTRSEVDCPGAGYLGCFLDSHMRDMPWTPMEDAKMTVDLCIQHCRLQGYPFAGVSDTKCWCGSSYGEYGRSGECKHRCPGNRFSICGGSWANSVFNTTVETTTEVELSCWASQDCEVSDWSIHSECDLECTRTRTRSVTKLNKCGGKTCGATRERERCDRREYGCRLPEHMLIGCYRDGVGRDLPLGPMSDEHMTVGKCIYFCRDKGFKYAGLQDGAECFCGDTYGKWGGSYMCNVPCGGDVSTFCGGGWANTVYSTLDLTTTTTPVPTTTEPCEPVDCVPEEVWSEYGPCEGDCGEGLGRQYRWRSRIVKEHCGGEGCLIGETQTCTRTECEHPPFPDSYEMLAYKHILSRGKYRKSRASKAGKRTRRSADEHPVVEESHEREKRASSSSGGNFATGSRVFPAVVTLAAVAVFVLGLAAFMFAAPIGNKGFVRNYQLQQY